MDLPNKQDPPAPSPVTGRVDKKLKPVIPGATQVQRPATRRFFNFLFAESPKALVGRVGKDILVPRAKAGVEEALNSFIHGMFWGQGASPLSSMVRGTVLRGGGTQYSQISSGTPSALELARQANESRTPGNYQDIICGTQEHAELLLASLFEVYNQYRVVTVADLYEMANITPEPVHNNYGWHQLTGARIVHDREGYRLELPRPSVI